MQKEQGAHYMVVESWLVKTEMLDPTGSFRSPPVCVCVYTVCVCDSLTSVCVCVREILHHLCVCVYCHRFLCYLSPSILWVLDSHTCLPTNYRMFYSNKDTLIVPIHFKDFFFFFAKGHTKKVQDILKVFYSLDMPFFFLAILIHLAGLRLL